MRSGRTLRLAQGKSVGAGQVADSTLRGSGFGGERYVSLGSYNTLAVHNTGSWGATYGSCVFARSLGGQANGKRRLIRDG